METQRPPPVSSPAAHSQRAHHQPQSTTAPFDGYDYEYNEKDANARHESFHTDRGSRSSYGRGHDSVISQPFSPKGSSPPSRSSISSASQRQYSVPNNLRSTSTVESEAIKYPPQAYLDPEKHGYPSYSTNRGGPEADAIVYDQGKYHERGPEEKAWQLLVCKLYAGVTCSSTNINAVLPLRPMCTSLWRHRALDHHGSVRLARISTLATMLSSTTALATNHNVSCARAKSATAPRLLARLHDWLQRTHAGRHPLILANRRIWSCDRSLDRSRLLVLLVDTRRSWRSRRTQRWQREHPRCPELVGAMALQGTKSVPHIMRLVDETTAQFDHLFTFPWQGHHSAAFYLAYTVFKRPVRRHSLLLDDSTAFMEGMTDTDPDMIYPNFAQILPICSPSPRVSSLHLLTDSGDFGAMPCASAKPSLRC